MTLAFKFCSAEELVLYICTGTLEAEKLCLQLPEHSIIVRCENLCECFQRGLFQFIKLYVTQILSPKLGVAGSNEAFGSSLVHLKKMKALSSRSMFES